MVTTRSQTRAAQMSPVQQTPTRSQTKRKYSETTLSTVYSIDCLKSQGELVPASSYVSYYLELREKNIPEDSKIWCKHVRYYLDEISAAEKGTARINPCNELYKYLNFMFSDPTIIHLRSSYTNPSNRRFEQAVLKKSDELLESIEEMLEDGDISTASYNELRMNILTVNNIIQLNQ
jgi:hypothetical protein